LSSLPISNIFSYFLDITDGKIQNLAARCCKIEVLPLLVSGVDKRRARRSEVPINELVSAGVAAELGIEGVGVGVEEESEEFGCEEDEKEGSKEKEVTKH
jgi:hypothetical protein